MSFLVLLGVIAIGLWTLSEGYFYQTGSNWFSECWERSRAASEQKNFEDPRASNSSQAIAWAQCEAKSYEVTYDIGFVFAGKPKNQNDLAGYELEIACPSTWNDVPFFLGLNYKLVDLIKKNGGPSFFHHFLPAGYLIRETLLARWPHCSSMRETQGYPKIVKKGEAWDWAHPCDVCK